MIRAARSRPVARLEVRSEARPAAPGASHGFTLVEMIVALSIFGILAGAAFAFLMSQNRFYDAEGRTQSAQQDARGTVRILVDEIRRAGAGIHALTTSDPDIILPNDGTGARDAFDPAAISLVSVNPAVPRIPLTSGGNNGQRDRTYVLVPDTSSLGGLQVGDALYIENSNSGTTQLLHVTQIVSAGGGQTRIEHVNDPLEEDFPPSSSALWVLREVSVRLRSYSGDPRIERQLPGSGTWEALSENATGLTFRYFDLAGNQITPTSKAARSSIRRVEVAVTVTVPGPRGSLDEVDFVYRASVSPRNQSLEAGG